MKIQKHEDVGINSLRDLTKEELIGCIEYTVERNKSAKFWLERYVLQIADQRREAALANMEEAGDRWINLQKEYVKLLEPYKGKKIGDIPMDVIEKGAELEKKIRIAQEKYFATFG